MKKNTVLVSSKEAAQILNVPELALGQLAFEGKLTMYPNLSFCKEQVKTLSHTDLKRYR